MAQQSKVKRHSTRTVLAFMWLACSARVALAQTAPEVATPPTAPPVDQRVNANTPDQAYGQLLQVPVNTFVPGAAPLPAKITAPALSDPAAPQRGMTAFAAFNCIGCHMGNGGGGMGPSLSDGKFIYGGDPQNLYLTIVQGRPHGMPAWGSVLPSDTIWDLVAYVRNLSKAPHPQWGETVSAKLPEIEQVPAEHAQTPNPWQQTEPFKNGQKP
jgi:cytochrome c oxidase cbb3-type subunit III